jgi:hypothetical protein
MQRKKILFHMKHIKSAQTSAQDLECAICAKKFASRDNILRHLIYVHENIKDLECPICSKQFGLNFGLHWHLKTVHKNAKVFGCNIVHGDVQNFEGGVCAIQFQEKSAVAVAPYRQVNCNIECRLGLIQTECSIFFKNKSELEQHIQLNHSN